MSASPKEVRRREKQDLPDTLAADEKSGGPEISRRRMLGMLFGGGAAAALTGCREETPPGKSDRLEDAIKYLKDLEGKKTPPGPGGDPATVTSPRDENDSTFSSTSTGKMRQKEAEISKLVDELRTHKRISRMIEQIDSVGRTGPTTEEDIGAMRESLNRLGREEGDMNRRQDNEAARLDREHREQMARIEGDIRELERERKDRQVFWNRVVTSRDAVVQHHVGDRAVFGTRWGVTGYGGLRYFVPEPEVRYVPVYRWQRIPSEFEHNGARLSRSQAARVLRKELEDLNRALSGRTVDARLTGRAGEVQKRFQDATHELEDTDMAQMKKLVERDILLLERKRIEERGITPDEIKARLESVRYGVDLRPENHEQARLVTSILRAGEEADKLRREAIAELKANPKTRREGLALEEETVRRDLELTRRTDDLKRQLEREGPGQVRLVNLRIDKADAELAALDAHRRRVGLDVGDTLPLIEQVRYESQHGPGTYPRFLMDQVRGGTTTIRNLSVTELGMISEASSGSRPSVRLNAGERTGINAEYGSKSRAGADARARLTDEERRHAREASEIQDRINAMSR
ncbi:MAG: hypothetical protein ABIH11_03695 [Candidatus Altiarchaeota archaeon]